MHFLPSHEHNNPFGNFYTKSKFIQYHNYFISLKTILLTTVLPGEFFILFMSCLIVYLFHVEFCKCIAHRYTCIYKCIFIHTYKYLYRFLKFYFLCKILIFPIHAPASKEFTTQCF